MTSMRVHHLNCGTLHPPSRRLVNGEGGLFEPALLVCHCLLVETPGGLVLVDSGIGSADIRDPSAALGDDWRRRTRPALDLAETAKHQVTKLGYDPGDVRHIVLTHLHRDHAGGIADFPWATVHVTAREHDAAMNPANQARYRSRQWAHRPAWATYPDGGEDWFGFQGVRRLDGPAAEILLVPLPGHSPGHAAVAVNTGPGWLLHAGDAYFFRGETDPRRARSTPGLALFQRRVQTDGPARRHNQRKLRDLRTTHSDRITVFSAHDHTELQTHLSGGDRWRTYGDR